MAVNVVFAVDDRCVSDSVAVDHALASFGPGQAALSMLLEHAQATGVTAPGRQGDVMMAARRGLMSLRARRLGRLLARPS